MSLKSRPAVSTERLPALPFRSLLFILAVIMTIGSASGDVGASAAGSGGRVLRLDAIGKGFGFTPVFYAPVKNAWGIDWRYRCAGAKEFDMVIWEVINAVDLSYILISQHGPRGNGYRMETGQTSGIRMPNGGQAGVVLSLHVKTTCLWHIRVVAGKKNVVRRWVPRYVNRSSWTKT